MAQALTPKPISRFSDSNPDFADAPVATIRASAPITCLHGGSDSVVESTAAAYVAHQETGAETSRLAMKHVHHFEALDSMFESGIVLDLGGDGQFVRRAVADPSITNGFKLAQTHITGSGQSGGAGTDNYDAIGFLP